MAMKCIKQEDGKIVCTFSGPMDTTQCLEAEKEVMKIIESAKEIIFNLDGVDYVASSFLRLCGIASHKVSAGNFSIINATPTVKKVFKIAGLAERLNLID